MLQDLEVVVGLDRVPYDRPQPLERLAVGLVVAGDLRFAVEVEGAALRRRHGIFNSDALAVQEPVGGLREAVARRRRGGRRRRGVGDDGSER